MCIGVRRRREINGVSLLRKREMLAILQFEMVVMTRCGIKGAAQAHF